MPVIVEIKMYEAHKSNEPVIYLVEKEYYYKDIDEFEMRNDTLAYKIAEIAREELERIRKEKFLLDNPELNIGGEVESEDPF